MHDTETTGSLDTSSKHNITMTLKPTAIEAAACSCISAAFLAKSLKDVPHMVDDYSFARDSYSMCSMFLLVRGWGESCVLQRTLDEKCLSSCLDDTKRDQSCSRRGCSGKILHSKMKYCFNIKVRIRFKIILRLRLTFSNPRKTCPKQNKIASRHVSKEYC